MAGGYSRWLFPLPSRLPGTPAHLGKRSGCEAEMHKRGVGAPSAGQHRPAAELQTKARRAAAPPGEKLIADPQGPAWGPAEDRAAWSAVLRHPHGAEGAASVPGDACAPLRRRGHPAPNADAEGPVAANARCAVAGGRGRCAGLALPVLCLRPTASLSGRFLPRGPDLCPLRRCASFTLSLSLHPWQPSERFSLLPSGHFS